MHAPILSDPEFHSFAPEILKAIRRDRFVDAAADLYGEIGLSSDEFEAIATAAAAAMRLRDSRNKAKRLGQLALLTLKRLGADAEGEGRRLAEDMFEWARRHDGTRSWEVPSPTILIGFVVGSAEHAMAADLPYDPDRLAETVHAAVGANSLPFSLPFSLTDIRDTLRAMTVHRPLADWTLPEEVERLRPIMHAWLIKSLQKPGCVEWLRDVARTPDMADWILKQMQTPDERALLRKRLVELREKRGSRPPN